MKESRLCRSTVAPVHQQLRCHTPSPHKMASEDLPTVRLGTARQSEGVFCGKWKSCLAHGSFYLASWGFNVGALGFGHVLGLLRKHMNMYTGAMSLATLQEVVPEQWAKAATVAMWRCVSALQKTLGVALSCSSIFLRRNRYFLVAVSTPLNSVFLPLYRTSLVEASRIVKTYRWSLSPTKTVWTPPQICEWHAC